jgi:hypothetical protein
MNQNGRATHQRIKEKRNKSFSRSFLSSPKSVMSLIVTINTKQLEVIIVKSHSPTLLGLDRLLMMNLSRYLAATLTLVTFVLSILRGERPPCGTIIELYILLITGLIVALI